MNLYHKGILIGVFTLLTCIGSQLNGHAQRQPVITAAPLIGDSVKAGKTLAVQDSVYFHPILKLSIAQTKSVDNIVSLYINEFSNRLPPDTFEVIVRIEVNYELAGGSTGSRLDTLRINFSKNHPYNSKAIKLYKDYHAVEAEVLDVTITGAADTAVRPLLVMENMMVIDRHFITTCTAIGSISSSDTSVVTTGELSVSWPAFAFIPTYELEWTYIDKAALDSGNYNIGSQLSPNLIFKNNSTRVSLNNTSYRIPLLYDGDGSLFFRVRTIQYAPDNEVLSGQWSTEAGVTGLGRYDYTGHQRNLNWQATTSYAEGGIQKSVVQYYGGDLRGRQIVTKDNTTKTTVVAETLYDKQGRAVIQVLPSPTLNTLIAYNPLFNVRGINTSEYEKSVYDTLINQNEYCATAADSMSSTTGAAKYYSTLNPLANSTQQKYHQYIPNANGYPFSETRYTRDNTSRIDRQGGVGTDFRLGTGHETRYYYASPDQKDLDALFGTEAGDASHYQKNMIRDANGQYSVTYIDIQGRTIASALAGKAPASLQQLSSYDSLTQTDNLLTPANNVIKDNTILATKSILVPVRGDYTFNYSLSPESLSLKDCKDLTICYDCLYDLTISISDNCNNEQFGGSPKIIRLSNFSLFKSDSVTYNLDTTCYAANIIDTSFSVVLEEGSYDITKVLSVSKSSMEYYRDSIFLAHNTCKSYQQLVLEQLDSIRQHLDCTPDSLTTNLVVAYREQMMADLTPLSGQYTDTITVRPNPADPIRPCFSIFDKDGSGRYIYQTVTGYKDEDGKLDSVSQYNAATGDWALVKPESLIPDEFITNFKQSWAEVLLIKHPEYPLLLEYEKLKSAYNWESGFFNTETFADAIAKGYLNPTGSNTAPANNFTVANTIDSLFIALAPAGPSVVAAAKQAIDDKLFKFLLKQTSPPFPVFYNLWGTVTGMVKCGKYETDCFTFWNQAANAFLTDSLCAGDLDQAWRIFRSQYLRIREDWIDDYTRARSGVFASQVQAPCIAVFPNRDIAGAPTGPDVYGGYNGTTMQDSTTAANNFNAFLLANCTAYATKWWQELAPCGFSAADSAAIINKLIQVAYEGADKNHPFGSSTVKPSSTYVYRSFQDVIDEYVALYPGTNPLTCNAYLLPNPKPYNQPGIIINLPIIAAPDSCSCARINEHHTNFLSQQSIYHTFSNYMLQAQGTHISQGVLDSLLNLCNNSNGTCTYLEKPILLPPAFQCGTGDICVDCGEVTALYNSFTVQFPGILPAYEDTTIAQHQINQLFANYMNQHLGFSKTTVEYLDFMGNCPGVTPACDSLQDLQNDYLKIRQEMNNGTAAAGYRITPLKDEMIEIVNGILEVEQGKHLNETLSSRYAYVNNNNHLNNKLYTLSTGTIGWWTGDPDSAKYYMGIWPMNAKYVYSTTTSLNTEIHSFTDTVNVLAQDFVGTTTAADLTKKYYGATVVHFRFNNTFSVVWGSRKAWSGICAPNLANYWGVMGPYAKYLHDTACHELSCDYYYFAYVKKPVSPPASYTEYTNRLSSGPYYEASEIKKVLSYSLDTMLIRLYKQSGGAPGATSMLGHFIKVKLLLANNSIEDAWLQNSTCTNMNLLYTEAVDSTIYDADCQKGFAAYYNSKKGTNYTFQQIDSISQVKCGKPLYVCNTNSCDSSGWIVYNPGTNLEINADLYANAHNNIDNSNLLFNSGYFNAPTQPQANHYVLVNKKDEINAGSATVLMQWRVKPVTSPKMINPFVLRGTNTTYVGATWIKDPTDTSWWIGATILNGADGNTLKGIGLQSNNHDLKADWVKITNPGTGSILYFEDFLSVGGSCDSTPAYGPFLCGKQAADSVIILTMNPCADTSTMAIQGATYLFDIYRKKLKGEFEKAYMKKCLDAGRLESFTVTHPLTEYHYTLYFYDQADNLVKTVPPEGVDVIRRSSWMDSVSSARTYGQILTPSHRLATTYRYNSLNQVISQHSFDGGLSRFWYDRLGRLTVSQNAKQAAEGNYSYTIYDVLGRITETGQKKQTTVMTDDITRSPQNLATWLGYTYTLDATTVIAEQVIKTVFDVKDPQTAVLPTIGYVLNQAYQKAYTLRNRVSYTRYYDKLGWNGTMTLYSDYDNSSTFSYDIHGNIDTLLNHYRTGFMAEHGLNQFKITAYNYDLMSSKVYEIHYQPGMTDQFYQRYEYDANDRITDAYTTDRKQLLAIPILEEHEARYEYYKHGPLARVVLGQQQVQGIDYAYMLQGWLKGVNNDSLVDADGQPGSIIAKDVYRFSINYYNGDYFAIGNAMAGVFPGHTAYMGANVSDYKPLYNGNISSIVLGIAKLGETKLYNYGYDQISRLVRMDVWKGYNTTTSSWSGLQKTSEYEERISYDGNGNIKTYQRNGNTALLAMDTLTYQYPRSSDGNIMNNRLRYVHDRVADANYAEDIDKQTALSLAQVQAERQPELGSDNYSYDAIGNLIKDTKEGISNIEWTVYGKIKKITKTDGTVISYRYDAAGNRISKAVNNNGDITTTWYNLDAQGSSQAIYTGTGSSLVLGEHFMYGSKRLGTWEKNIDMDAVADTDDYTFARGHKIFELKNHLDNVLVTISDKKLGIPDPSNTTGVLYYTPEIVTANDYYSGGMDMPGRQYSVTTGYRFGFNGKEKDSESPVQYDYGFRIYDPRLVRFKSVDPLTKKYAELTPYQFASNNPIEGIDMDGLEYVSYKIKIEDGKVISKVITHDYRNLSESLLNAVHKGRLTYTRSVNYGDHGDKPTIETYTKNFYSVYSVGFGSMGRGVLYEIEYTSKNSPVSVITTTFFDKESSQAGGLEWLVGRVGVHGIYYGPGCPTVNGGEHDFKTNPYDYSLDPVDEVDGIAKQHDMEYDQVQKTTGEYKGYKDDTNTIEADKKMVAGWEDYLKRASKKGFKDKYTGKAASKEAITAAKDGIFYFKNFIIPRKERLKNAQERVKKIQEQQKKGRGVTTVSQ